MNSVASRAFWRCFDDLSATIQDQARAAYQLWMNDPGHRSLNFKYVHASRPVVSVRIGLHHRALGIRDGDTVVWFWIGSHAEYDNLVKRL